MTDLGTLGGTYSQAYGINASGQVVGYADTSNSQAHAFLCGSGVMNDLGTLGGTYSDASGINASAQIVGDSFIQGGSDHAFLYSAGLMLDLNGRLDNSGLGWVLVAATAINDNGWIAGEGVFGGKAYPVLLTPLPEPSSLIMLAIGGMSLGGVAITRRRRSRSQV